MTLAQRMLDHTLAMHWMRASEEGVVGVVATPPPPIASDTGEPSARPRWVGFTSAGWIFGLLFAINVVNYLDRILAVAAGPAIKAEFRLTDFQIGALTSAFLIIYTLASLPLGLLADRVSRTRIVALGLLGWSIISGATGFVRGFGDLFLTRAGVGVGEASYSPAGTALLGACYPRAQRAKVFSRWGSGQIVGTALAFILIGSLDRWLGASHGWRVAFWLTAVPGVVLALLMWRVRERPAIVPEAAAAAPLPPAAIASNWRVALTDGISRIKQVL